MSAIITSTTRSHSAKVFLESLPTDVYFFAAKIDPWDDENSPDPPASDIITLNDIKREIVFMKKASSNGILGLRRFNWESGTVYTPWNSWDDFYFQENWLGPEQPFYVIKQEGIYYNVYLCLDNNNGAESTDPPENEFIEPFVTDDGYKWQFMYRTWSDITKYVSSAFIPCPYKTIQKDYTQIDVETGTTPGTIDRIFIEDGGSGYSVGDTVISIAGDGTIPAEAEITSVDESGAITQINIISRGSNYSYANVIISGDGSGAEVIPVLSPRMGHGSEAYIQLCATHILIFQSFNSSENNLFLEQNAYRRIGLIRGTKDFESNLLTENGYSFLDQLDVTNITTTFPYTQRIIGLTSGASARIYNIDPPGSTSATFYITDKKKEFALNEFIQLENSPGTIAQVTNIINTDIDKRTGDLLYLENIKPVSRNIGQSEGFIFSIEY